MTDPDVDLFELYADDPIATQLLDEHLLEEHHVIRRQGCPLCHAAEVVLAGAGPQLAPPPTLRWDPARNGFVRSPDEVPEP